MNPQFNDIKYLSGRRMYRHNTTRKNKSAPHLSKKRSIKNGDLHNVWRRLNVPHDNQHQSDNENRTKKRRITLEPELDAFTNKTTIACDCYGIFANSKKANMKSRKCSSSKLDISQKGNAVSTFSLSPVDYNFDDESHGIIEKDQVKQSQIPITTTIKAANNTLPSSQGHSSQDSTHFEPNQLITELTFESISSGDLCCGDDNQSMYSTDITRSPSGIYFPDITCQPESNVADVVHYPHSMACITSIPQHKIDFHNSITDSEDIFNCTSQSSQHQQQQYATQESDCSKIFNSEFYDYDSDLTMFDDIATSQNDCSLDDIIPDIDLFKSFEQPEFSIEKFLESIELNIKTEKDNENNLKYLKFMQPRKTSCTHLTSLEIPESVLSIDSYYKDPEMFNKQKFRQLISRSELEYVKSCNYENNATYINL